MRRLTPVGRSDAVDPANRPVAGELERALERSALAGTPRRRRHGRHGDCENVRPLGETERKQLIVLGADLVRAWSHPAATAAIRKRILRTALHEIVVKKQGPVVDLVLHWQPGDHTALQIKLYNLTRPVGIIRAFPTIRSPSSANWPD